MNNCLDGNCPEVIFTSDVQSDVTFVNISIPSGSNLNFVLLAMETYFNTTLLNLNNVTYTLAGGTCIGLSAGSYSYSQIIDAIIAELCSIGGVVVQGSNNITVTSNVVGNVTTYTVSANHLIVSTHPESSSVGSAIQTIGNQDGYVLGVLNDMPNGTVFEIEIDLQRTGLHREDFSYFTFLLTESNTHFPSLEIDDSFSIPLSNSNHQSANIKITLTKVGHDRAFVSMVNGGSISEGSAPFFTHNEGWFMSKFITISTLPNVVETLKIRVKPSVSATIITLNRITIKKFLPQ